MNRYCGAIELERDFQESDCIVRQNESMKQLSLSL